MRSWAATLLGLVFAAPAGAHPPVPPDATGPATVKTGAKEGTVQKGAQARAATSPEPAAQVAAALAAGRRLVRRAQLQVDPARRAFRAELFARALAHFERAAALAPGRPDVLVELARAAEEAGRYERAARAWARHVELAPYDRAAEAEFHLARASLRLWRFAEAEEALERALGRAAVSDARLPTALGLLGAAHMGQGRLADAIDAYLQAIAVADALPAGYHDGDVGLLTALAAAYDRDGQIERAARVLSEVIRRDPELEHLRDPLVATQPSPPYDLYYFAALVAEHQGRSAEAAQAFRAYLAASAGAPDLYRRRAREHLDALEAGRKR